MKGVELHPKYQALGNDTRYFIVTGGRGSGKSFGVNTFLALLTMEPGHKILFTRYTMVSASTSIIPEFIEKLELLGVLGQFRITKDEIINKATESSIIFKGIRTSSGNQTAALKSLQGITTWVLDEAEELTNEEDFDKIDMSVRAKNQQNRIILILNPTLKTHFIYGRFFAGNGVKESSNTWKNNVTYIHTTYKDNIKNLSNSFLLQVEEIRRRRPDKYNHQIMGGWLDKSDGAVFNNYTTGHFNDYFEEIYGQDFGFSIDPTTLIRLSVDVKNKKMWVKECYVQAGLTTKQIAEKNLRYAGSNLIICDNSEPRLLSEMKDNYSVNVKATIKKKGSILSGIALMQNYDIIVDPDSENILKELANYSWHHRNEKPRDDWNHCLDAIRYALQYVDAQTGKGTYVIR